MAKQVLDVGPVANQLNIAAAGAAVNDIAVTIAAAPGPVLLIGRANFTGGGLASTVSLEIRKNALAFTNPNMATGGVTVALAAVDLTTFQVDIAAIGDIYTLFARTSASDGDINAGLASLAIIGLHPAHAQAAQPVGT